MEAYQSLTVPHESLVMTQEAGHSMQKYLGSTSWVRTSQMIIEEMEITRVFKSDLIEEDGDAPNT